VLELEADFVKRIRTDADPAYEPACMIPLRRRKSFLYVGIGSYKSSILLNLEESCPNIRSYDKFHPFDFRLCKHYSNMFFFRC